METERSHISVQRLPKAAAFQIGDSVIYGLHGKCTITGIETRTAGSENLAFYKLEPKKSPLSRSQRKEPAIWVPVNRATEKGLRKSITREEANSVLAVLESREYYFSLAENWNQVEPKLDATIQQEGAAGLAKVHSYLYVLKHRQVVPHPEISRLDETVSRALFKELSEALDEQVKSLEQRMQRPLRQKLSSEA